jgi:hypothetical protein
MRLPNLLPAAGGVLFLSLLSGCAPSDTSTPPEPTETFVAPYATDEEALAAAEEAYAAYVLATGVVYSEERGDPAILASVASGEHLDELLQERAELEAEYGYINGVQTFDHSVLQRYSRDGSPREVIAVYLCDDLSELEIFKDGIKFGPEEPLTPATMQVIFDYSPESDSLLVSSREIWSSEPC